MKGETLKAKLERLGILASYSRPGVSDDNPCVEWLFGTMKSRVGYPKKPFETLEEAQAWVNRFAQRYHEEHRHSSLNWVTPMARHTGAERELLRRREETYRKAQQRSPQRWSRGIRNCSPAPAVTLNPRKKNNDLAAYQVAFATCVSSIELGRGLLAALSCQRHPSRSACYSVSCR